MKSTIFWTALAGFVAALPAQADQATDAARIATLGSVEEVIINPALASPTAQGSVHSHIVSVQGCILISEDSTKLPDEEMVTGMRITVDLTGGGLRPGADGHLYRYTPPQGDDPLGYGAVWITSRSPAVAEGITRPKNDPPYASTETTTPFGTLMTDVILGSFSIEDDVGLQELASSIQTYVSTYCSGSQS